MPLRLVPPGAKWSDPGVRLQAGQTLFDEYNLRTSVADLRLKMQDVWFLLYLMVDITQDAQPPSRQRHYSNRVPSIVDTSRRVLTQNPIKYHVVSQYFPVESDREERQPFRNLENVYHGLLYDIDRQQRMQGKRSARGQAAFHALVRGAWAYKLHLTSEAGSGTGSPVFYEQLDPRQVLPVFEYSGISSAIAWDVTSFNQLYYRYTDVLKPVMDKLFSKAKRISRYGQQTDYSWMHAPVKMIEWSRDDESAVMIDLCDLPAELCNDLGLTPDWPNHDRWVWLQPPVDRGFGTPLIHYGNVNPVDAGLPTREAADKFGRSPLARYPLYRGGDATDGTARYGAPQYLLTNGWMNQALSSTVDPIGSMGGRSIFAQVAHLIPEYNDFTALLADAVYQEVRGTWVLRTRSGQMFEVKIGTGEVNPMQLGENLEKVNMQIATPDAQAVLERISQEISDGSLDLRSILAADAQDSGGYMRQRLEQAAIGQLDDYKVGIENWAEDLADTFNKQYRKAHSSLGNWKLQGRTPGKMTTYFVVDLDDTVKKALTEKDPPIIEAKVKAQLPIDMMAKINMAKSAIDPSNPVMGLRMALDIILEVDDADAVFDQILEDIGNRNPTLQLMKIAQVFIENGAEPLAQMIMQDNFRQAFSQQQAAGSGAGGTMPNTSTPSGASAGILPTTASPEAMSASGTENPAVPQGGAR